MNENIIEMELIKQHGKEGSSAHEFYAEYQKFQYYSDRVLRKIDGFFHPMQYCRIKQLQKELKVNIDNVENEDAKHKIFKRYLKSFIAEYGNPEASNPSDTEKFCECLFNVIFKDQKTQGKGEKKYENYQEAFKKFTQKQESALYKKDSQFTNELDDLRRTKKIPKNGRKSEFFNKLSGITFKRLVHKGLYAHWQLKANKEGKAIDFQKKVLDNGYYSYVILKNNEIRFLPTSDESSTYQAYKKYRSHEQIADGQKVYSAGVFKIENGFVTYLDSDSGHYATKSKRFFEYSKKVFERTELNLNDCDMTKEEKPTGHKMKRLRRRLFCMFKGLTQDGRKADNRPDSKGVWENKIPSYSAVNI